MRKTLFSSDHHFGHTAILGFCNRPWTNIVDMDVALIDLWNQTVQPDDIVWYLGDFSFHKDQKLNEEILSSLAGEKHLIIGNHDRRVEKLKGWASVQMYKELNVDKFNIVLFHYPMVDWRGRFNGSYHLYGHTHNRWHPAIGDKALDVGVDANGFKPIELNDTLHRLENGWQGPITGWNR